MYFTLAKRNSPWDRDQTIVKLRAKHVIYQKFADFIYKKDIYVNRVESIIFGM